MKSDAERNMRVRIDGQRRKKGMEMNGELVLYAFPLMAGRKGIRGS